MGLPKNSTGASGLLVVHIVDGLIDIIDQDLDIIIGIAFDNSTHAREHAVVVNADQGNALCGTPHFTDLGHTRTHQPPARPDQHDLVGCPPHYGYHNPPVA